MEYALGSLSVTWGKNNLLENTTQSFHFKVWGVVCILQDKKDIYYVTVTYNFLARR